MPSPIQETSLAYTATVASPATKAFTSNVTAGSLLLVFVGSDGTNDPEASSVADTVGSVWADAAFQVNTAVARQSVWWAVARASGPNTVTVNRTGGGTWFGIGLHLMEFPPVGAAGSRLDTTALTNSASSAANVAPTFSGLAGSADLVVYWAGHNTAINTATGGIWTDTAYDVLTSGPNSFFQVTYATTGPSVTGPTLIPGTSAAYNIVGVAFAPAASSPPPAVRSAAFRYGQPGPPFMPAVTYGYGSPAVTANGVGTGAVIFDGSGVATVIGAATGTGAITFAGSGTAAVTVNGAGAGAIVFAGSGTATVPGVSPWRLWPSTSGPSTATAYAGPIVEGTAFYVTAGGLNFDGYWMWVCPSGGQATTGYKFCLWQQTPMVGEDGSAGTHVLVAGTTVTAGTLTAGWNFVPLGSPFQLAPGVYYRAEVGFNSGAGFPFTASYWTANVVNGPLVAPADSTTASGDSALTAAGSQSLYDTSTADPTLVYPATTNSQFNPWLDVQVSTGSFSPVRMFTNAPKPNNVESTLTAGYNLATAFTVSVLAALQKIWWFSGPSAAALPDHCGVWVTASKTILAGTDNSSPAWKKPGGAAASAGDGWVYVDYSAAGIVLQPATNYKFSISYLGGASYRTVTKWFWGDPHTLTVTPVGVTGFTNGILTFPNAATAPPSLNYNLNASTYGPGGQQTWTGPNSWGYPDNFDYPELVWQDIEILPVTGTGAIVFAGSGTATSGTAATGTGALVFAGSGTATVTSVGVGSGAITFGGAGTGTVTVTATGTGAIGFGGSGTSGALVNGTGSGAIVFAGTGVATSFIAAAGTGAIVFAGTGTATAGPPPPFTVGTLTTTTTAASSSTASAAPTSTLSATVQRTGGPQ